MTQLSRFESACFSLSHESRQLHFIVLLTGIRLCLNACEFGEQHNVHRLLTSSEFVSTFLLDFLNGSYWFEVKNRGSLFLGMQQKLSVKFFKMVMATHLAQSKVEFSRLVSWQSQEISWSMDEHLLYVNMSHVLKGIGTNYVTRDIVITMAGRRTTDVICVAKRLFPRSCWRVT